jgi:hypothetical protein
MAPSGYDEQYLPRLCPFQQVADRWQGIISLEIDYLLHAVKVLNVLTF